MSRATFANESKRGSVIAIPSEAVASDGHSLSRPRGAYIFQSGTVQVDIIIRPGLISYHCELLIAPPPDGRPFFLLFSSNRAAESGDESRACFDLSVCQWRFAKNPREDFKFCM